MESLDTKVGSAILITGRIEGDGNVVVEGRVEGAINIKGDLQIDPAGVVKSSVQARNIYVMGLLVGDATAGEKLELAPGGRMIGDARTPRILINEGSAFRGNVDMVDFEVEERSTEARRTPRPSTVARTVPLPTRVQAVPPQSPRTSPVTPEPRREPPVTARAQVSTPPPSQPVRQASANLYTPPPLPRPPEFLGSRKAIVIKKKANEGG